GTAGGRVAALADVVDAGARAGLCPCGHARLLGGGSVGRARLVHRADGALAMASAGIEPYLGRSRALDLSGIDWDAIPRNPLSAEAVRTLRYMQDIETHTVVYLRTLLSTRAIDDPDVATF